ncbi:MAG: 3-keto-disaccharide hydrolase [Chitinophagaceae bacterium]
MKRNIILTALFAAIFYLAHAQEKGKPQDTEFYSPVPAVVTPGGNTGDAPSDAIILFDGKNLDQWVNSKDSTPAKWVLADNVMTVNKSTGDIQTRATFTDFQLHIEYFIPANITGSGQARGNSGIFLAALPWGAGGYEMQVLDNYKNTTYVNGQVGSMYKQAVPLANACKKPGEWQTYDVIWTAPKFSADGILKSLARVTAFHNGVLVQNNTTLLGDTPYIGQPSYRKHGPAPIKLQSHGDKSEPISFRNIWLRVL